MCLESLHLHNCFITSKKIRDFYEAKHKCLHITYLYICLENKKTVIKIFFEKKILLLKVKKK
jgi:hypothetical protein